MKRPQTKTLPSAERLRELLHYDPATGILTWRVQRKKNGTIKPGTIAGGIKGNTHRVLDIDGVRYLAHRVIWKIMTGDEPPPVIDHIDMNTDNNIWENLREATLSQNSANRGLRIDNSTGVKGVVCVRGKYRALIGLNGHQYHIGYFNDLRTAALARAQVAKKLHGAFART